MVLTAKDRDVILAMFRKALTHNPAPNPHPRRPHGDT
jgi:hypothetical protein